MAVQQTNFSDIYKTCQDNWSWSRICISPESDESVSCWGYLDLFGSLFVDSQKYHAENKATWQWLIATFGRKRIERIIPDLDNRADKGKNVYVPDIRNIFALSGDVRREDLQERYGEGSLENLSREDLKGLYDALIPIQSVEVMFFGRDYGDTPYITDSTIDGWTCRVWFTYHLHNLGDNTDDWLYRVLQRVLNFHITKGTIIPHPGGCYEVTAKYKSRGVYPIALKSIRTDLPPILACLPTQVAFPLPRGIRFDSAWEDLSEAPAVDGVIALYDRINDLFTNPVLGLVRDSKELVILAGWSLGGAAASRLACLFEDRVSQLVSVNGLGLDEPTINWIKKNVRSMKVLFIENVGDHISNLVYARFGYHARNDRIRITIRHIAPANGREEQGERPETPLPSNFRLVAASQIAHSLATVHSTDTTRESYVEWFERNTDDTWKDDKLLGKWEGVRPKVWTGGGEKFVEFLNEKRPQLATFA